MITGTQLPKPKKWLWIRSMLPPVVVGVLLIAALGKWVQWRPEFMSFSRNAVYRVQNGTWQRLPELPGRPEKVRVSAGGKVWALFWRAGSGSQLARLDGPSWRIFTQKDFGTRGVYVSAGFVLDGEDLWAPTQECALHWDGASWKCYRDIAGVSSLVAANGKAWAIDDEGKLSHFDGSQWTLRTVELPGATWSDAMNEDSPELARTEDGSLWIVFGGVWRSTDGVKWAAVTSDGEDFKGESVIGSTGKGIWLWDGTYLDWARADGTTAEFEPADMGLTDDDEVYEVTSAGDRPLAATTRGILELDGDEWRPMPPPPDGVQAVVSLRAGSRGDLVAIGSIPNPGARRWSFLQQLVPLVLTLGILAVPVWMVRRYKRNQLSEHLRLQEAVAHATGEVPEEFARDVRLLTKQSSWWSATVAVGVIVGAMLGYSILRIFRPATPPWMFLVIALALHLVVMLGQSLVRRTPKPWDPIEPGGPSFDWGPTRRALPGSLAVFVLMNMGAFPKWMGDPVLWLCYAILAVFWSRVIAERLRIWAIRRGDYDGAIKVIRRFYFYNPEGGKALWQQGHILLLAGRFREAEQVLRRAVAGLRSRSAQAHALESLGDALQEQGRHDEALRSYEAALHAAPGSRRPYRGMAELMLRQGRDRARALEYVENIVGPSGPSRNRLTSNGQSHDDYWALKAWALAELGRGAEVAPAVAEAIRVTNAKSHTDVAATYRRLGMAMKALDRQGEAEAYLKKARDADPQGRWAALAAAALAERTVFRT